MTNHMMTICVFRMDWSAESGDDELRIDLTVSVEVRRNSPRII